jgi:hypothetical protein
MRCEFLSSCMRTLLTLLCFCRVCVDLCTLMEPGSGLLVGSFARTLFLVQAECSETLYINSRPFRVNAGPVRPLCKSITLARVIPKPARKLCTELRECASIMTCLILGSGGQWMLYMLQMVIPDLWYHLMSHSSSQEFSQMSSLAAIKVICRNPVTDDRLYSTPRAPLWCMEIGNLSLWGKELSSHVMSGWLRHFLDLRTGLIRLQLLQLLQRSAAQRIPIMTCKGS